MSYSFNFEYKYIFKSDFNPNIGFLSKLYLPFINKDAFCLYSLMCEEHKNFHATRFFKNKALEIANLLCLNEQEFELAKNSLEAFGLLKTFLSDDKVIYFELFEPLAYASFIQNELFIKNLENKIGKDALLKLQSQYESFSIPETLTEVTVNQEEFLNNTNFCAGNSFNFENLYKNISKVCKLAFTIDQETKAVINNYYVDYKLSESEIEKCVYSSIVKENGEFVVNKSLITKELNDLTSKSFENIKNILKINHNKKIFMEKSSLEDLNVIFKNYRNFSSEQFYNALTCEEVEENELEIFSTLRNKYLLTDQFINMMVDFSIRKTHGQLNAKYLYKMARSFKLENIETLHDAYDFLISWDNKKTVSKKEINNNEIIKKELKLNSINHSDQDFEKESNDLNYDKTFDEISKNIDILMEMNDE